MIVRVRSRCVGVIVVVVVAAGLLGPPAEAAPRERTQPLPVPSTRFTPSSSGNPITRSAIAGSTQTAGGERAAVYVRRDQAVRVLGTLGGAYSAAADVNTRGDVAGISWTSSGDTHAFYLRRGTSTLTDLGTLGGDTSYAYALNDSGVVVGTSLNTSGEQRSFRWDPRVGTMEDLGALTGGSPFAAARGINPAGDIVGESAGRAFLWRARSKQLVDLGVPDGSLFSAANDINARGVIVGRASSVADDSDRPVVWAAPARRPRVLPGSGFGEAEAVNRRGVITGELTPAIGGVRRGVVWSGHRAGPSYLGATGAGPDAFVYGIDSRSRVLARYQDRLVIWRPLV